MDELLELLEDIKEDVDFEHCDTLIDDHIIDSFDILQIMIFQFLLLKSCLKTLIVQKHYMQWLKD